MFFSKNTGIKWLLSTVLIFILNLLFAVPFVPGYSGDLQPERVYPSKRYFQNSRGRDLPNNILVLLVEFSDVTFDLESHYPDFHPHDVSYFSKYLEHLGEYYRDNSRGEYNLTLDNFTIHEHVFTLSNSMGYYGEDNSGKSALLISDLIELADPEIDFTSYDGFIVFHAGGGQEVDLENSYSEGIISTFLSIKSFQSYFEPENEDYPGISTDDDIYLTEFVLCPETLWLPYFQEPDENGQDGSPIYNFFGVLTHHFGHLIGLPTLFDNDSSNGRSRGIGGFGVMSYGAWNGNGYVPATLCAWSRYYLGWQDAVEISAAEANIELTYLNAQNDKPELYKINISETEYFLLENYQQNPDNSFFINTNGDTLATYSFALCADQEYYDVDPYTGEPHPYAGQPKFDFFKNSYEGCEWQFYMPGYAAGDAIGNDGSGILIWHIDELVINENFTSDFTSNSINGDAVHKGVDLEEADGIQDFDSIYSYVYGSKDDSFRAGNNDYFGQRVHNGLFSAPTSESYYGGSLIEVSNISQSDSIMTFDVSFGWSLSMPYAGEVPFEAALLDFDADGENELFSVMPNGNLTVWKDDQMLFEESNDFTIEKIYSWDQLNHTILIPAVSANQSAVLKILSTNESTNLFEFAQYSWASHVVVNTDDSSDNHIFAPLNDSANVCSVIKVFDRDFTEFAEMNCSSLIASNLVLKNKKIAFIDSNKNLITFNLENYQQTGIELSDLENEAINSLLWADLDGDSIDELVVTTDSKKLFCYSENGNLRKNFPVEIPINGISVPSLADLDNNGFLEIIYGGENKFVSFDHLAKLNKPEHEVDSPDSLNIAGGAIAIDLDNDGSLEVLANVSRNRLVAWERISDNNFRIMPGFPTTFQSVIRTYPVVGEYSHYGKTIYLTADNGLIFKQENEKMNLTSNTWLQKYGNLNRTAYYSAPLPENIYETDDLIIQEETYFYPNPLNPISGGCLINGVFIENSIALNLMTSKEALVEIDIYDIAGNKILSGDINCEAYVKNSFLVDCSKLSSGVYFAIIKSDGDVLKKKFAIEK